MNALLEQEIVGKPVTVKLRNGAEFPIAFPMGVVILIKKLTGINIFEPKALQEMTPNADPERFQKFLWAALHTFDPDKKELLAPLSEAELSTLVDFGNLGEISQKLNQALAAYLPKPETASPNEQAAETQVA